MRITVNLSIFFHDHRSLVKIFINKHMKCVKDVIDHIGAIFHIENFYLKYENQYLPPTEDIHIFHDDDFIWAVPLSQQISVQHESDLPTEISSEIDNTPKLEKKKKKHKNKDDDSVLPNKKKERYTNEIEDHPILLNGNSFSSETNEHNQVEKKKKRRKHQDNDVTFTKKKKHSIGENLDSVTLLESEDIMISSDTPSIGKKKKKKKIKYTDNKVEEYDTVVGENCTKTRDIKTPDKKKYISPKDSGLESLGSGTVTPPSKNVNVKNLVDSFERKQIDFIKPLMVNAVQENERKINIVKTIIISNGNRASSAQNSDCSISYDEKMQNDARTKDNVVNPKKDLNTECPVVDKATAAESVMSDSGLLNTTHLSNEDSSMSYSTVNGFDMNVNKRRRRRTHRRKRVSKNVEFSNSSEQELLPEKTASTQTPMHVRFNDDLNIIENVTDNKSKDDKAELKTSPQDNEVNVINKKTSEHDSQNQNALPGSIHINDLKDADLEKFISKQPITQNTQPRANDMIAFKILRLSESYTPEVSSTVIGKVLSYNLQSKEILFEIVYGWDQCTQPKGKFSFNEEMVPDTDNKFQCSWLSLLEPRIVFP